MSARREKAVPLVISAASEMVTAVPLVFGHHHLRDMFRAGRHDCDCTVVAKGGLPIIAEPLGLHLFLST